MRNTQYTTNYKHNEDMHTQRNNEITTDAHTDMHIFIAHEPVHKERKH